MIPLHHTPLGAAGAANVNLLFLALFDFLEENVFLNVRSETKNLKFFLEVYFVAAGLEAEGGFTLCLRSHPGPLAVSFFGHGGGAYGYALKESFLIQDLVGRLGFEPR